MTYKAYLPPVSADDITPELILAFHNHPGMVWMRDDYLSMRGMAAATDPDLFKFLERVAEVKEQARRGLVKFHC